MRKADAKKAILRDWRALKPEERATELHAEMFAMSKVGEYKFRTEGDKRKLIKGWLARYIGKN
jgi:hypothetical protein